VRFEPPRPRNDEERVLPLINVVFLLLIFFMLAGRIAANDPFEVTPPRAASESGAQSRDMLVLISPDGRIALDGEVVTRSGLEAAVAARLTSNAGARVRLKADGGTEASGVVAIMETLRAAGVERLKLLTVPEAR
jgi:biopolymer transport protein ExbD